MIVRPIITEKSMADARTGKYLFAVPETVSKDAIKKMVTDMFGVHATQVTTSIVKGKRKRVGKRREERADSVYKKALVQVKKGEKIGIFEPGGEEK